MILNTSIKYWPAEYHSQSAIEAALFLRKEIGDPSKIQVGPDREPRCLGRHHRERTGEMETGDARDGRSQSALHHRDRVDRRRSDGEAISAGAFHGSEDLEIPRERDGGAQRRAELALRQGGREHRARRRCRTAAR